MPSVTISSTAPRATRRQKAPGAPRKRTTAAAGTRLPGCAAAAVASKLVMQWASWKGSPGFGRSYRIHPSGSPRLRRGRGQDVVAESIAQDGLLDLTGRGMGDFVDERDLVGHPPAGDLAAHERQDLVLARGLVLLEHDHQERSLVPFRMLDADHGGLRHRGMADREVLQIDRGDPLAAGLDHVLGAIRHLHIAIAIDGGDVAGVEEALRVEDWPVFPVVGARDAGAAHLEAAEGLAVPRQPLARIVGDLHLDHERRVTLLLLDVEPGIAGAVGVFRLERADGP